jgi:lipopolysaccharide/colanic/teichoic acid biosynthesis glycosyltransferase
MPTAAEAPGGTRQPAPAEEAVRRALDLCAASVLLVLLSPVLVTVALAVRLSSPGPILFRQRRVGRNGVEFELLKFRSMRAGNSGPGVTAGGDSRITPVGARLRKWKLDELPQLLNVVRGEMSLVGPRPEVERYVRHYTPEQRAVLSVRPGITGVAQLEYRDEEALLAGRDDVEAFYIREVLPAKLALDLKYLRERTLASDLRILLRTAVALAARRRTTPPP